MKHIKRFNESFGNPNAIERGINKVKSWFKPKEMWWLNMDEGEPVNQEPIYQAVRQEPTNIHFDINGVSRSIPSKEEIEANLSVSDFDYLEEKIRTYLFDNNLNEKYFKRVDNRFDFIRLVHPPNVKVQISAIPKNRRGYSIQPININEYLICVPANFVEWKAIMTCKTIEESIEYIMSKDSSLLI